MSVKATGKNSALLGLFALVAASALAWVYLNTYPKIKAAEKRAQQAAIFEVLPVEQNAEKNLEALPLDEATKINLGLEAQDEAYAYAMVRDKIDGKPVFDIALPSIAGDGYSGNISLLVGIQHDGVISGVRVLKHRETPGLGDKIELAKSNWIKSFNGKSLASTHASDWQVKKNGGIFDAFTGATITPSAVVNQVHQTLKVFHSQFVQSDHSEDEQ